jgi:hypothetical protein
MTSHVVRLYAAAGAILAFFLSWAGIAARPWTAPKSDPAVAALAAREQRIQAESVAVQQRLDRRWAAYRAALAARRQALAAARPSPAAPSSPGVRIVTLPPLTVTRSS